MASRTSVWRRVPPYGVAYLRMASRTSVVASRTSVWLGVTSVDGNGRASGTCAATVSALHFTSRRGHAVQTSRNAGEGSTDLTENLPNVWHRHTETRCPSNGRQRTSADAFCSCRRAQPDRPRPCRSTVPTSAPTTKRCSSAPTSTCPPMWSSADMDMSGFLSLPTRHPRPLPPFPIVAPPIHAGRHVGSPQRERDDVIAVLEHQTQRPQLAKTRLENLRSMLRHRTRNERSERGVQATGRRAASLAVRMCSRAGSSPLSCTMTRPRRRSRRAVRFHDALIVRPFIATARSDRGRNANWRGTFRRKPGRRNVRGATRPKPKRATSACNGAHRVIWMCPGGGGSRCFSVGNALTIASVASVLIGQPLQNVVQNYDAQSACEQQPSPSDPMHLLLLTRMPTHCSAAPSAQPSPTTNHVILQKTPIQVLASLPPNNRVIHPRRAVDET